MITTARSPDRVTRRGRDDHEMWARSSGLAPPAVMSMGDTPSGCSVVGGFGRIVDLSVLVRPLDVAGAGMGSRVELYAAIRFDWQRNQMSVRALAEKYSVHRRTVREAIASPIPPPRKSPPRRTLVLDSVREVVDAMLVEDLTAPRK